MLLTDLFAVTVARHGEHVAIDVPPGRGRSARTTVTYAELDRMAANVRAQLAAFVDGECVIAIGLPRTTPWLFAAQIAIMQLGAAYVCLDPAFPAAHAQHVLRDAGVRVLFTDGDGEALAAGRGLPIVQPASAWSGDVAAPRPAWADGDNLAYVIYTSGSTGKPKGVLIEHRGAVNLIRTGVERFAIAPGDRIAQGSSAAYDSSVEELWLALAGGATAVVLDDETVRLGPDLVSWLRAERITVLCPPPTLLRAMDCRSPRDELPQLRLCYVGGEALPADLAATWGGALWLENGYGPTECTVTVVRGRALPGQAVTIGEPVPPHRAVVVDEHLQSVADGTPGELLIAGPGLARGYLGLPELTAQRFPTLPGIGRVYRTGDLVVRGDGGRLAYLGRIDAQVKLRGFRIELEGIEACLLQCEGVREVACDVQGDEPAKLLVAHIVPTLSASPPDPRTLAAELRGRLPDYMVPGRFVLLDALPRTVGGKVDRRRLPRVDGTGDGDGGGEPATPLATSAQQELRTGFAAVLGLPESAIAGDADFFDLGGDSLRAAMLVSQLRRVAGWQALAVTDIYLGRTIAAIATRRPSPSSRAAPPASLTASPGSPLLMSLVQTGFLGAVALGGIAVAYGLGFVLLPWLLARFSLPALLLLGPWLAALGYLAYAIGALWVAVAAKWLLIGRYRATRVPAWSGLHLRHWLVGRCVRLVPWTLFAGTELVSVALRLFGARVGRRVHVHRGTDLWRGGWDLLDLGDDVTLGREVQLGLCELDDGHLVVGPVRIGRGATLEVRAGTGPDVEIGDAAIVTPLSFVAGGARVAPAQRWDGVPARAIGDAVPPATIDVGRQLAAWTCSCLLLAARVLWAPLVLLPYSLSAWWLLAASGIDGGTIADWLCGAGPESHLAWCLVAVALAVLGLPASLVAAALLLRWSPKVPTGTHARWSFVHLRLQVRTELLERAGLWLSGTLFWPWWLRLAGMRVGADCEVSTILDVLPECVALGSGSFLADGIYLGAPRYHAGRVTVLPTSLGERTFLGNHVVVPTGQRLPDDLLLGVSTIADDRTMGPGSAWFGHPAFLLPRRERIAFDRRLTHEPGALRYTNRLFWEALRLLLPALPVLLGLWWLAVVADARPLGAGELVRAVLLASVAAGTLPVLLVWALKWLLLGRVLPGQHGLWSCWASRWDFLYVVWQRYGRSLQLLEGTLLLPWFLRAMGMRIGRRCVLGDGFAQVVDPDMITIEDGATVHALFQAHSFEDRVLKIDRVRIGRGATVGRGTVVLYGADIGDRAQVMPHSVVMKREQLLPHHCYAGVPSRDASASTSASGA